MYRGRTILSILLILLLVVTMTNFIPNKVVYGAETTPPDGYVGIYSAQDLSNMRNNLSGKYVLMNDINMTDFTASGDGWVPVGTEAEPFTGVLDGNGYSISELRIHKSSSNTTSFVGGLFGYTKGLKVSNLTLATEIDAVAVRAGHYLYLGGIAGQADAGFITNCNVNIKAKGKAETVCIGGIIGRTIYPEETDSKRTVISGCKVAGEYNVAAGSCYFGGIVGRADRVEISDSTSSVNQYVFCTSPGHYSFVGGILGTADGALISNCQNLGKIAVDMVNAVLSKSAVVYCGGIAGSISAPVDYCNNVTEDVIVDCTNKGALSSTQIGEVSMAGIVNELGIGVISRCTNQGTIKNLCEEVVGAFGIVRHLSDGTISGCSNQADVICHGDTASGITGENSGNIIGCSNWGSISANCNVSGIATSNLTGTISKCYNAGEIGNQLMALGICSGGISSDNTGNIEDCYNIGSIKGNTSGGITSKNRGSGVVERCINLGGVSALGPNCLEGAITASNTGMLLDTYYYLGETSGCGKNASYATDESKKINMGQMKTKSTYSAFNFGSDNATATWEMSVNSGLPKLTGMSEVYVSDLSLAVQPQATRYLVGSSVKTKGAVLKATLSNGKVQYVDFGYSLSPYENTKGTRNIYMNYGGKSTSFSASFGDLTLSMGSLSYLEIRWKHFAKATDLRIYTSNTANGNYKLWTTSDLEKDYTKTNDLTYGKTYYFRIRPMYGDTKGTLSSALSVKIRPVTPAIEELTTTENAVTIYSATEDDYCSSVEYVPRYEVLCATSIGGPYTKVVDSNGGSMRCSGLTLGKIYYFVVRSYVYENGVKVYSKCSPVQWGRLL